MLKMFVCWGCQLTLPPPPIFMIQMSVNPWLYGAISSFFVRFRRITFRLGQFTKNEKLFSVVMMDFRQMIFIRMPKKKHWRSIKWNTQFTPYLSFHSNGNSIGFHPRILKLKWQIILPLLSVGVKTVSLFNWLCHLGSAGKILPVSSHILSCLFKGDIEDSTHLRVGNV